MIKRVSTLKNQLIYIVQVQLSNKYEGKQYMKAKNIRQILKTVADTNYNYRKYSKMFIDTIETFFSQNNIKNQKETQISQKQIDIFLKQLINVIMYSNGKKLTQIVQAIKKNLKNMKFKKDHLIQLQVVINNRIQQRQLLIASQTKVQDLCSLIDCGISVKKTVHFTQNFFNIIGSLKLKQSQILQLINIYYIHASNSSFINKVNVSKSLSKLLKFGKLPEHPLIAETYMKYQMNQLASNDWIQQYIYKIYNKFQKIQDNTSLINLLSCLTTLKKMKEILNPQILDIKINNLEANILTRVQKLTIKEVHLLYQNLILRDNSLNLLQLVEKTLQNHLTPQKMDSQDIKDLAVLIQKLYLLTTNHQLLIKNQLFRKKIWKLYFKFAILCFKSNKQVIYYARVIQIMAFILVQSQDSKNNFVKFIKQFDIPSKQYRNYQIIRLNSIFTVLNVPSTYIAKQYQILKEKNKATTVENLSRSILRYHNAQELKLICNQIIKQTFKNYSNEAQKSQLQKAIITSIKVEQMLEFWVPFFPKILSLKIVDITSMLLFLVNSGQIHQIQLEMIMHLALAGFQQFYLTKQFESILVYGRLDQAINSLLRQQKSIVKLLFFLIFISKVVKNSNSYLFETHYSLYRYLICILKNNSNSNILNQAITKIILNDKYLQMIQDYLYFPQLSIFILWLIKNGKLSQNLQILQKISNFIPKIVQNTEFILDKLQIIEYISNLVNYKHLNLMVNQLRSLINEDQLNNLKIAKLIKTKLSTLQQFTDDQILSIAMKYISTQNQDLIIQRLIKIKSFYSFSNLERLVRKYIQKQDLFIKLKNRIIQQMTQKIQSIVKLDIICYLEINKMLETKISKQITIKILHEHKSKQELISYLDILDIEQNQLENYFNSVVNVLNKEILTPFYMFMFGKNGNQIISNIIFYCLKTQNSKLLTKMIEIITKQINYFIKQSQKIQSINLFEKQSIFWILLFITKQQVNTLKDTIQLLQRQIDSIKITKLKTEFLKPGLKNQKNNIKNIKQQAQLKLKNEQYKMFGIPLLTIKNQLDEQYSIYQEFKKYPRNKQLISFIVQKLKKISK